MYILKNAYINITRKKSRNILIGIIICIITTSSAIALTIHKSASSLVESYKNSNPLEVSFNLSQMNFKKDKDSEDTSETEIQAMTVDDIKNYGDSSYVKDFYYTKETALSSDQITAVSTEEDTGEGTGDERENAPMGGHMQQGSIGDFRLTGYSDPSYIDDFISGTKKIIEGEMFTKDSTANEIIISEDLKDQNGLNVGDTIVFYLPSDSTKTYEFKIIGIYEDGSDIESDNFMNINAMNSRNQIYTNISVLINNFSDTSSSRGFGQNLSAKFYLYNNSDLESFTEEVRGKGLSEYYSVVTNEEEVLASLKPIQNVQNFSMTFLIIILIVGSVILAVINLINIRERKYEIGVLRAIGMSKGLVILEFMCEIFMVACVSLVVGIILGYFLSQPVTNKMLENEINSYQEETTKIENNFGGKDFQRPSSSNMGKEDKGMPSSEVDYVDTLDVKMDALIMIKLFFVSILLTLTTSFISVFTINKYEPNKILQNR